MKRKVIPTEVLKYYFNNGSLRTTAKKFNIHYQTLFKWVKLYQELQNKGISEENKKECFLNGYKWPWNRFPRDIEEKIVLVKENNPSITIRKAKEMLEKEGIKVSVKGIWNVWKRYGYIGFKKENMTNDFMDYCEWSKEAKAKFEFAKFLFEKGQIKKCSETLNTIPFLPKNDIISSIPDEYLNLRRRIEKIATLFGKVRLVEYLEKIQKINYELETKKFYYSFLRMGFIEVISLQWAGELRESLKKIKKLKNLLKKDKKSSSIFPLYFNILLAEGVAHAFLMKINNANKISQICNKILKNKKYFFPYYFYYLGLLYMNLEKFKQAEDCFLKCLNKVKEDTNKRIKGRLAIISLLKGNYEEARIRAKEAEFGEWSVEGWNLLFNSLLFLIKGMPEKAISSCTKALSLLKEHELIWGIFTAFFTMASCYSGLGEKNKSIKILREIFPILEEKKLKREIPIINMLLSKYSIKENIFPTTKLLWLLKTYGYKRALSYAKKNYLLSYFYRYLLFFPEKVNKALQRGEKVEIPKTLLKFPVFNKNYLTFNIQFLSPFKIYRNHKLMKIKLSLREKAFLIYLSQKLKEPEDSIIVEEICKNFWSPFISPKRKFSRLFLKIKEKLKIPFNFLILKRQKEGSILLNKRIYFRSDLDELDEKISKGKAFLRIGKNKNAKKEFLKAFSLIKCKPFEKMYDRFSEDKRTEIIFKIKDAFEEFLKTNPKKKEIKMIKKKFVKLKIPSV